MCGSNFFRYIWKDLAYPQIEWRDGALDSGMTLHELGHAVSSRLTGGPANANCIGGGESGGISEGFSGMHPTCDLRYILMLNSHVKDFLAVMARLENQPEWNSAISKEYHFGSYLANNDKGMRNVPYVFSVSELHPSANVCVDSSFAGFRMSETLGDL